MQTIADQRLSGWTKVVETEIGAELIERWALDYLGRYASSVENLRRVLLRRVHRRNSRLDVPARRQIAAVIDKVIERHCRAGLVDDAAFAAQRARSLHRRGESLARIGARLTAKGVAGDIVADALSALQSDASDADLAAACALARRRRLGPYRTAAGDHARELAVFARAGFARRIAEAVLACGDIEAIEALARNGID